MSWHCEEGNRQLRRYGVEWSDTACEEMVTINAAMVLRIVKRFC